jgi:hypothetical protein
MVRDERSTGWPVNKWAVALTLTLAAAAMVILAALTFATCSIAPNVLGAGPEGIDLRPTPEDLTADDLLPQEIAGYARGECRGITAFRDFRKLNLGTNAVEASYAGPTGTVRIVAARMLTQQAAAAAVREIAHYLEQADILGSRRLRFDEPSKGWWSASGKRNFAYWRAPTCDTDRYGFVWQSGRWCFIVASNSIVARRDVSLAFPY